MLYLEPKQFRTLTDHDVLILGITAVLAFWFSLLIVIYPFGLVPRVPGTALLLSAQLFAVALIFHKLG